MGLGARHTEGQESRVRDGEGRAALLDTVVKKASWRGQCQALQNQQVFMSVNYGTQ